MGLAEPPVRQAASIGAPGLRNVRRRVAVGHGRVDSVAAVAGVACGVDEGVALHLVVAAAAVQLVGLVAAVEEIVAAPPDGRVPARSARELVVSAPAEQDVARALAADEVVATEAVNLIGA